MRLRCGNGATVMNIVDLLEYMRQRFDHIENGIKGHIENGLDHVSSSASDGTLRQRSDATDGRQADAPSEALLAAPVCELSARVRELAAELQAVRECDQLKSSSLK